jgi:hypothetical protein
MRLLAAVCALAAVMASPLDSVRSLTSGGGSLGILPSDETFDEIVLGKQRAYHTFVLFTASSPRICPGCS